MPNYLYIEDDALSRKLMSMILGKIMQVEMFHIFEDSENFLERVGTLPQAPDIFLLDIHMKPLDGFEMLKLLRSNPIHADKPVIALTASVMNEEVEQLRAAGFDGVIAKPLDTHLFPHLIERIWNGEKVWHVN